MKRCFSAMKPQQAPWAARQAFESGCHTASSNAQSMNFHARKAMTTPRTADKSLFI